MSIFRIFLVNMAKSERKSKWKRKFRAIKREKNKKKELMMLNSVIEKRSESASEVMSTEAPGNFIYKNEKILKN